MSAEGNIAFPGWMDRTVQLLGEEHVAKIRNAHVLVAGLGGVGSMAAEALVRAGVGKLTIVDHDLVQETNLNRQILALGSNIGEEKSAVIAGRMKDINPDVELIEKSLYINEETLDEIFDAGFDFVVDAIDTLTPKILFIEKVVKNGLPLASSMGSGGKLDPTMIKIADFKKSYNCRLAYILRKKLRKRDVHGGFKVVFSTESTDKEKLRMSEDEPNKKSQLGTISYIPMIFGCMLASIVIEGLRSGN